MGEHRRKDQGAVSGASAPLDVYRVVVCARAICDKQTDLLTFVDVHEAWTLPEDVLGQVIAVQAHFGVAGDGKYEVRASWRSESGGLSPAVDGTVDTLEVKGRQRFAVMQIQVPKSAGNYALVLEWRFPGDLWTRGAASAPITLIAAPAVSPPNRH